MKDYKDKRILITGINGFIGRNLAGYLAGKLGCNNVFGIDRQCPDVNISAAFKIINIDLESKSAVDEIIKEIKPEIIFHLAASINPSRDIKDLDSMINTNILGTVNLLSAVQRVGPDLDCFINMGTGEEYGNRDETFIEDMLPDPVSIYSGTKAASAMLCRMFYNIYGIPVVTARPSLVYGPDQSDRFFIIQAIKTLLAGKDFKMTEGEQTRDFIYITDLISALVLLSKTPSLSGEIVNVSSGIEYSLKEIVMMIAEITESGSAIELGAIQYRQNEIMRYSVDNSKLKAAGWSPSVQIKEGLEEVLASVKVKQNHFHV